MIVCHISVHFTLPFPLMCLGKGSPTVVEEMTKLVSWKISTKRIKIFMPNKCVTRILSFKRFRVRMTLSIKVASFDSFVGVRLEPMQSIQVYTVRRENWYKKKSAIILDMRCFKSIQLPFKPTLNCYLKTFFNGNP